MSGYLHRWEGDNLWVGGGDVEVLFGAANDDPFAPEAVGVVMLGAVFAYVGRAEIAEIAKWCQRQLAVEGPGL